MRSHLIENTMSLLGGAGLGAALMYLFDPDLGESRRADVRDAAGQAVSSTGDALHSTVNGATDSARSFASRISDYAHDLADRAGSESSSLTDRASSFATGAMKSARKAMNRSSNTASDYASDAADRARGVRDDLADRASSLWSRARRSADLEGSHPIATATGITAGTIGVLALGAGLMYFMDPERGRGRRAWASDKIFSVSRRTGRRARSFGRHVGNQMKGAAHEARNMVPESWTGGESAETSGERRQQSMPSAGQ
jgi:gas vesicle protein